MDGIKRSRSEPPPPPPPIVVEDTATEEGGVLRSGIEDVESSSTTYQTRPPLDRQETQPHIRERRKGTGTDTGTGTFGHRRKHSPILEWPQKWTKESWAQGRVLLLDYVVKEYTVDRKRNIVAKEFSEIDSLRRFYRNEDPSARAALRVMHVQNAPWATRFLLRKFNIDPNDDLVGTTFGRWARYTHPQQRGGKPVLNGKAFRAQRDPWRGISRTAFGTDYLKHYDKDSLIPFPNSGSHRSMMELNHYDEDDHPKYGQDVYVQRLSVYVQLSDGTPGQAIDPDIPNPYDEEAWGEYMRLKKSYGGVDANEHQERYIPKLRSLDNGNTIIIFENSVTGSVKDTLISARQELESRWRRLTFYLPRDEVGSDEQLTGLYMNIILTDIFKATAYNWEKFFGACETHVGILEDKIYENPADESRAPELWKNSAQWLKVERLIYIHADLVREMVVHLHDLAGSDPKEGESWLGTVPDEVDKLTGRWERDIVLPTTALSDLMYKSVGIRDARHSLQLGLSMWRLSWITFIFLPLTFTVGFFGMNVSTFSENPPIKYYFIVSAPVLALVLILWYAVKHNLASQRQNPMRRGVYESLYHELATSHSTLWTRVGPLPNVVPVGWWDGLKWHLLTSWFSSEKLRVRDDAESEQFFGAWGRIKRALARRWLDEISVLRVPPVLSSPFSSSSQERKQHLGMNMDMDKDLGAVGELLNVATPVAIAEFDPRAARRLQMRVPVERLRSLSPRGRSGRASSRASSSGGVAVEEKGAERRERLDVPS